MMTTVSRGKRIKARLLFYTGWIFVVLGFIGVILPLVPTTPFLLVATAIFYKTSPRFYNWILGNRYFGRYIRDFKEKRGIPLRVKIVALLFMWTSLLLSTFYLVPLMWVKILMLFIGIAVTVHIMNIKTKDERRGM
jgi:uncharacterized membrane protein YbaN (DUF454 family)